MKLSITDLSLEDRPREKFEALGASSLSTAELLAILIGSGSQDENAVQLMQRVMNDCKGSLACLGRKSIAELCQYKGLGPAKAITMLAACELGNRRALENAQAKKVFTSANDIYNYFLPILRDKSIEESHILLLKNNLSLITSKLISRGGITGTVVDIRLILKEALLAGATHIALCHNHPSGNAKPSRQDDELTKRLKLAAKQIDITLIDHIIVTDGNFYSYSNEGCL